VFFLFIGIVVHKKYTLIGYNSKDKKGAYYVYASWSQWLKK